MLDHAPGATPGQLQHALKPLAELLPQFQGEHGQHTPLSCLGGAAQGPLAT